MYRRETVPASDHPNLSSGEGDGGKPFEHENPELGETSIEAFLKKVLIERQIITHEQLSECLEERDRRELLPPLASILLRKGYLNDEHLEDLLHLLSSRRQAAGKEESIALGENAVRSGLTTNVEILSALEIQERERQKGANPRLGEVLVRRGTLTVAQIKEILEKQGRSVMRTLLRLA